MLSFDKSTQNRHAGSLRLSTSSTASDDIPSELLRKNPAHLPELSELQVIRHFTNLSQQNYSIDTHFYPLGSCTMKYNPRAAHQLASLPGFLNHHPFSDTASSQGILACLFDLQEILKAVTGMAAVSLSPMAGAQGEFAGVTMIKAYHEARGDHQRNEMIVPDAAHGTNPASAAKCGFVIREVATTAEGDVDLDQLQTLLGPKTAGIMLTNPSTLGVFERKIQTLSAMVHKAGGLLYYDGANLNAILGRYRPGDMGFDVMHLNLHKTFATPHGGGGPGAGPVAANSRLAPYLPIPMVAQQNAEYCWLTQADRPKSIGRLNGFMGNTGVLLRAYIYAKLLGRTGMQRVSTFATLNANYLLQRLVDIGYTLAYPQRRGSHEFIITIAPLTKKYGITALDIAKRLIDYSFHPPTIYFPLLVPECLLIEPTETECLADLDRFVAAMQSIMDEIKHNPELLKQAPTTRAISRLDEVAAARQLNLRWQPTSADIEPSQSDDK